jgi:hypothetical protein
MGRLITSNTEEGSAGYFRIGNTILDIPPEQIQCHKVINGSEVMPLRFPFALQVKTGQARWDVTWSWKAIIDPTQHDPYFEWEKIRMLLAMFKAAPFVEVENDHIRQIVSPGTLTPGADSSDVMAFALKQMRIDTVPDLIDTLQVTMTMSLFNYRPYSANFQYADNAGNPVASALVSPLFQNYLNAWIETNLNNDPTQFLNGDTKASFDNWQSQAAGSLTLSCREYTIAALPRTLFPPQGGSVPSAGNPAGSAQGQSASQGASTGDFIDNVTITDISPSNPKIQWWVTAVSIPESNGNYSAINLSTVTNSGAPSAAVGVLQWVRSAAIDAMTGSDKYLGTSYISTAVQAGYLVPSIKHPSNYAWGKKTVPNPQSADPVLATFISWMLNPPLSGGATQLQNDMGTAWAMLKLKANSGSVLRSWEAHRFGQGVVNNGQGDPDKDNKWFSKAVTSWQSSAGDKAAFAPAANNTPIAQPVPPAPSTMVTSGTDSNAAPTTSNTSIPPASFPMTPYIRYLLSQGWTYDYTTENAAFLFKEHWIRMANQESGEQPACSDILAEDIDANFFVQPNQLSIIFVNNIAQLSLASYQYPTYQHLGPVSTLVSVGMLSTADIEPATDSYDEPKHIGLEFISNMTSLMENQFQRLRNEWRRVNSIHRMQSYVAQNQILNMLGIRGLLVRELTTETVPDSPNIVNAQLNLVQYENVYAAEEPSPFKVTAVPKQISQTWLTTLRDGSLNQFADNSQLTGLVNLSKAMQNPTSAPSQQLLYDWLTKNTTTNHLPDDSAYLVPTPSSFTGAESDLMLKLLDEKASTIAPAIPFGPAVSDITLTEPTSFTALYPDWAARIKTHNQLNYSDYFLIKNGTVGTQDYSSFAQLIPGIDQRIANAVTASNGSFEAPLDQLFDLYVDWIVINNTDTIRDQMVQALNTPQLKNRFLTPDGKLKPGSLQVNKDHGCYTDLGIKDMTIGGRDYTPAYYFYDNNAVYTGLMQAQVDLAATTTSKSATALAQATPMADKTKIVNASTEDFTSTVKPILNLVHPSAYTMAKAYPTFKLFLMEDHSDRPFFAYDNFYSYATVLDLEIIRYCTRPDNAVIQISNLMHLLDQHLYDGTPQGRFEQKLRARTDTNLAPGQALTAGGGGVAGVSLDTAPGGEIVTLDNRFTEIQKYNGGGDPKFPLKYFALQTGSKIQIRMGFSNNPDLLVPVFTGQVTQLEGDEILTITAQSYMLELIQPTSDEIRNDGFSVDGFINQLGNEVAHIVRDISGGNLLHLPSSLVSIFGNTPAYSGDASVGGLTLSGIYTPGGTAKDVMAAMLKTSTAKHFGGWQYGAPTDRYLKGFKWQQVAASTLLLFGGPLTQGATGLESGYDRSYENILTSHIFGPNGTASADPKGGYRGWNFEKPAGFGAPEYYVKKNLNLTPWTLIQDIARRFPEYILAVKQYGFPFSADATLVFGNPHDLYTTRVPQPLEQEIQQQSSSDNKAFFKWWLLGDTSGRTQFRNYMVNLGAPWGTAVLYEYQKMIGANPSAVTYAYQQFIGSDPGATADLLLPYIDGGGAGVFFNVSNLYKSEVGNKLNSKGLSSSISTADSQSALQQIINNYFTALKQQQAAGSNAGLSDRMKPIRQYHLVNGDSIIHNGITLNGDFYNTVRLIKQEMTASLGIPSNYTRVLDASPFLVSEKNVTGWPEAENTYMQTFLRDEIAKMYRGELVLLGNPEIEPFDVVILLDPSTGISGPIEVDSVIHSFNQENGFITIVRPRAMVIINDALSMPVYQAQWKMLCDLQGIIEGKASTLGINAVAGEAALASLAVAGLIAAGPWIASAALLGSSVTMFWAGKEAQRMNPFGLAPLTRYERPWVAGIEGWQNANLMGFFETKWSYFKAEEWEPLVDSYRTARGMQLI